MKFKNNVYEFSSQVTTYIFFLETPIFFWKLKREIVSKPQTPSKMQYWIGNNTS